MTSTPLTNHAVPPVVTAASLWKVAWPIMVSRISQSVVNLSDVKMVAPLGTSAIAATATGGMNSFAHLMVQAPGAHTDRLCQPKRLHGERDVRSGGRFFGSTPTTTAVPLTG